MAVFYDLEKNRFIRKSKQWVNWDPRRVNRGHDSKVTNPRSTSDRWRSWWEKNDFGSVGTCSRIMNEVKEFNDCPIICMNWKHFFILMPIRIMKQKGDPSVMKTTVEETEEDETQDEVHSFGVSMDQLRYAIGAWLIGNNTSLCQGRLLYWPFYEPLTRKVICSRFFQPIRRRFTQKLHPCWQYSTVIMITTGADQHEIVNNGNSNEYFEITNF